MLYRASNGRSDVLNPLSFILSRDRSVKRTHITSRRYRKDFPQANHDDLLLTIQMKARRGRRNPLRGGLRLGSPASATRINGVGGAAPKILDTLPTLAWCNLPNSS